MEKEITIAYRHWGTANRRAAMTVCNNKVNVKGFTLGYHREIEGPKLENLTEIPKKLRKEVAALARHRCPELSKAFSAFIAETWQKAKAQNDWFNY